MESAKRASVVIIVWNLNFSFFLKEGKQGERGKKSSRKMLPPPLTTKNNKKCNFEKVKNFSNDFFFHSHE